LRQNLADKARDKTVQVKPDWFKEIKQQLEDENADIWRNQRLLWQMLFLMIEGKQLLRQSNYGRGWRAVPLPGRPMSRSMRITSLGFIRTESRQSGLNLERTWFGEPPTSSDQSMGAAKVATMVHDYYARKLYTPTFLQTEAMMAQCGKYARYYYYSDDAERKGRFPVTRHSRLLLVNQPGCVLNAGDGGSRG
jgi:hypothetical protein